MANLGEPVRRRFEHEQLVCQNPVTECCPLAISRLCIRLPRIGKVRDLVLLRISVLRVRGLEPTDEVFAKSSVIKVVVLLLAHSVIPRFETRPGAGLTADIPTCGSSLRELSMRYLSTGIDDIENSMI
jgi:hypothetical protein